MTASDKTPAGHGEIDEITQQATTGHEWDGIKELDRPLPRWWLITFYVTIAFALVWVVLYPAIPLVGSATSGLLGFSTRDEVAKDLALASSAQAGRLERVAMLPLEDIRKDAELARFAASGGRSAYAVNCLPCHGTGAAGSPGYPNLNDDDWLWGGDLASIANTITHGVRFAADAKTQTSAMPAFGEDKLLTPVQIGQVTETVLRLSGQAHNAAAATLGEAIFTDNCAACHGDRGQGNREFGAPALNDKIWLYGGDRVAISAQITKPRQGVMPAWGTRLDPATVKQLVIYVHALGGGEAAPATSNK